MRQKVEMHEKDAKPFKMKPEAPGVPLPDFGGIAFKGEPLMNWGRENGAAVASTAQLAPERPGDEVIEAMGRPRRITPNDAGVASKYAFDLAETIHARGDAVTRAILAGTFIFGDFIHAAANLTGPCHVSIATLSYSAENVDALYTGFESGKIASLDFITSDFFYSHEKWGLWRMLVTSLPREKCRYAVAGSHAKVTVIKPLDQTKSPWVIEGSANLRSCQNVEQILVSVGDPESVRFHSLWMGRLLEKFELGARHALGNADVWRGITGA
jgi:hypothetical protein